MKNKTKHIILFFVLIIAIDKGLGFLISKASKSYKLDNRLELLLNNELKKDLFIVGSSRALNSVNPAIISSETSFSSYNLGFSGTNIVFHKKIIELILSTEILPKKIIYIIDDPATLMNMKDDIIFKKDEFYPFVNDDRINKIICETNDKSYFATFFSDAYKQNVNFNNALKYLLKGKEPLQIEINNIDENGANLMEGKKINFENIKRLDENPYLFKEESEEYKNTLNDIIELCKTNKVDLIFVYPPVYFKSNLKFKQRINEILSGRCALLDFSDEIDDNNMYYNHGHLNKKGSFIFSKYISSSL